LVSLALRNIPSRSTFAAVCWSRSVSLLAGRVRVATGPMNPPALELDPADARQIGIEFDTGSAGSHSPTVSWSTVSP
jgi:hypothetical protein